MMKNQTNCIDNDIEKIIYTGRDIQNHIEKLADMINSEFKNEEIVLVCVLNGSVIFVSDLARRIKIPCFMDFVSISSYGSSTVSNGKPVIKTDLSLDIKDKHVIIAEDIIDTGNTLVELYKLLKKRNPKTLKICSLCNKSARREASVFSDYPVLEIPDEFIVGYGLDYAHKYRNLPYIGILKKEIYLK